jgi:hypothetical protein
LDGPTMKSLIAGLCVIAVGSSACSSSGMSMGLGGGLAIAGGALLSTRQDAKPCDRNIPYDCFESAGIDASNGITTIAGTTLLMFGAVLIGLGVWGMAEESEQAAKDKPLSLAAAPPSEELRAAAATLPAQPTERDPHRKKLVLHIQLAARTNRCKAALYMMNELRKLDAPLARSLTTSDEHVAHCAVVSGASLRG